MVQDFAVCTKFAIARVSLRIAIVGFLLIRIFVWFTLLLLVLVAPVIGILLLAVSLLLLALLWPERSDVLFGGGIAGVLLVIDDVHHGPLLFVSFDSVVSEESVVSIIDCHPGLVLVGEQLPDIFRSGCPEYLSE